MKFIRCQKHALLDGRYNLGDSFIEVVINLDSVVDVCYNDHFPTGFYGNTIPYLSFALVNKDKIEFFRSDAEIAYKKFLENMEGCDGQS